MPYFVYDKDAEAIVVADQKPATTVATRDKDLIQNMIPVWHDPAVPVEVVRWGIQVLLLRMRDIPYRELNSAVAQITGRYRSDQAAIVSLGASPKIVKWMLKKRAYQTTSINVSKVSSQAEPTANFMAYMQRKLAKITAKNLVLIDYVHSGESLAVIKRLIVSQWKKGTVEAVALGVHSKFSPDSDFGREIDYVVEGIDTLAKQFEGTTYKQAFGRSKDMLDYATYPNTVKGGEISDKMKVQFAKVKPAFARAAELGPLHLKIAEFVEIQETEAYDSDDAEESMEESAFEDVW